jgi:hypothetical protein
MTYIVLAAIGVAAVVFLIFAGWPLYNTYRTRRQGADVRDGQEYLREKEEWEHAEADLKETVARPEAPSGGGPAGVGPGDTPLSPRPASGPGSADAAPAPDGTHSGPAHGTPRP